MATLTGLTSSGSNPPPDLQARSSKSHKPEVIILCVRFHISPELGPQKVRRPPPRVGVFPSTPWGSSPPLDV
ncbi:hypothetical protein AVEN_4913-1 [Araneus ventricosus]|uniref:Uncharacterized protein n=1 Tax=Araneus ventricosus TaxID=182803 RepID=A0A4Y2N7C6_ARAVE|nr:hypothetical protein AVEN_4913-1 [Araneus ventricosus]